MINARTYTVKRFAKTLTNGVITVAEVSTFEIAGNVQPMSDRQINAAPEGFREMPGGKFKFYTEDLSKPILVSGGGLIDGTTEPDAIEYMGGLLYVHGIEDRRHGLIPHIKYLLIQPQVPAT
jgi:hypothetical protein